MTAHGSRIGVTSYDSNSTQDCVSPGMKMAGTPGRRAASGDKRRTYSELMTFVI